MIGLLGVLVACGDRKPLATGPEDPRPDPEATFTRVQGVVFTPTCAFSGCHGGSAPAAGLDLSVAVAFSNVVGVPSTQRPGMARVTPGDPVRSYLVKKMRGDPDISGGRMPLGGPFVEAHVRLVSDWVRRGAPRD
jgi:hypothetical protein